MRTVYLSVCTSLIIGLTLASCFAMGCATRKLDRCETFDCWE